MKQRWLLLTHQLPDKPSNLRVKVWRKLQAFGAVAIKSSIYVLPNTPACREDFDWLRKDIVQSGGEAAVFCGDCVGEKGDREIERSFQEARAADYEAFARAAEAFNEKVASALDGGHVKNDALERLRRQWAGHQAEWERLTRLDFFRSPRRAEAAAALKAGQGLLDRAAAASVKRAPAAPEPVAPGALKGKVWVTRKSPHIDRLASAWLVRRFVDPKALFKFVSAPYRARPGEVRFDMPEAEFTHFGDWCTFETLIRRLGLKDPALLSLAEIVHDIDLKDKKYSRPEASGVALAVRGLCARHEADAERLEAGLAFFEGVYRDLAAEAQR